MWDLITNIILGISILTLAIFVCLFIYQWTERKDIKKVDPYLRWMPLPLVLMIIVYFVFDKIFIVATRPDGSGEPSFPSTHVMVVTTIFFLTTIVLPHYVKNQVYRIVIEILMLIAICLTCTGRILAEKHSVIDVIAALAFAFVFSEIYFQIIRRSRKDAKRLRENHQR